MSRQILKALPSGADIVVPFASSLADVGAQREPAANEDRAQGTGFSPFDTTVSVEQWPAGRMSAGFAALSDPTPDQSEHIVGGWSKRALDLVIASGALLISLPLMLMVALMIRASSRGPIFFVQQRVGFAGRMFPCFKFRTMAVDADVVLKRYLADNPDAAREWSETQKLIRDPRVTTIGRVLRKTSIDELPQLINVLRGEMSCVGPRPVLRDELGRYGSSAASYIRTRPGLTGLWQVSGRSTLTYAERVAIDSHYVENWSPWLDLKILVKTIPALINSDQAA